VLVLEQPNCETTTGTIKIFSPIDENLSFSIDGTNYQSSHIFSGLKSGSYGVTAKDNTDCISPVTDAVITEEPVVPEPPRVNVVYAACGEEGIAGIINFDSTYTYIFDPPGPVPDDNGNIMDFETGQS